ncbi:hypothetical protein SH449x_001611 [Pirellulaceae bacterium SH449]
MINHFPAISCVTPISRGVDLSTELRSLGDAIFIFSKLSLGMIER